MVESVKVEQKKRLDGFRLLEILPSCLPAQWTSNPSLRNRDTALQRLLHQPHPG